MLEERVKRVIEKIRPSLQMEGGDVELVEVTPDGVVKVRLKGRCVGCPFSALTLKAGIEREIKNEVPEVKEVVSV